MKRKYGILCLFLLLCLTACGETPEAVADPLQVEAATGMVYVPEFSKVEFDAGYLQAACLSGGNVYLVGDAIQESEIEGPGGGDDPHLPRRHSPLSGGARRSGLSKGGGIPVL